MSLKQKVTKSYACLEKGEFIIIIHWFSSFQIHLHLGSFDRLFTVCKFGVMVD